MNRDTGTDFVEEIQMKDFDFGYFGTGDEGYAQYMTAFERNFNTDNTDSCKSRPFKSTGTEFESHLHAKTRPPSRAQGHQPIYQRYYPTVNRLKWNLAIRF